MAVYRDVFMRTEIKYLLKKEQYESLREYLDTIARVDEYGLTRINNIYFDTPDYRLVRTSLEKPVYKEKLRLRTYGDTDDDTASFIEIKKKYEGVVYKRRIGGRYADNYDYLTGQDGSIGKSQIAGEIAQTLKQYRDLKPAMAVCYDRIAMAGIDDQELRITFDTDITYDESCSDLRRHSDGKNILKPGQRLMEIKLSGGFPPDLARRLSELSIFPVSFSKYGLGYMDMIKSMEKEAVKPEYDCKTQVSSKKTHIIMRKGVAAYV